MALAQRQMETIQAHLTVGVLSKELCRADENDASFRVYF